jgi:integrase/recombinase XerD
MTRGFLGSTMMLRRQALKAPIKTAEEFELLFAEALSMERPAMYRLMLLLSVRLGLRPMEIAGLDSSWFRGAELRIPLGHSKRKSGRSIAISEEIREALAAQMDGRTGRVFLNQRGDAINGGGISMAMRRLYRRAGVEGSCYSGRRTLATTLVDKGIPLPVVQSVLGHSNLSTTAHYIEVTDAMVRRALFG